MYLPIFMISVSVDNGIINYLYYITIIIIIVYHTEIYTML